MRWLPPTLADAESRAPEEPVRCRCGRVVQAQMLVKVGPDYLCDGCREGVRRKEGRAELARRIGAPPDVVAQAAAKDAARRGRAR